jgi:phospholipid/cholesterol/gamma-HCH transport system substrate-binding protein
METRANYILIGLFTLAVLVAGFTFVYWFEHRVVIDGPVSGLRTGAAVTFNGIRVGEVSAISLDQQNPKRVLATIVIDNSVPVRSDTSVGLEFQGLTGIAALALRGGASDAPAPPAEDGKPAILVADPSATQDVTETARAVLRRADNLISENQETLKATIRNIESISVTLAKNTERFDHIIAGAENLVGGPDGHSGELADTVRSVKMLSDNLDKRTAELTNGLLALASDARRTVGTVDRAVRNFDRNPSRIIFGGSGSDAQEPPPKQSKHQ